ncbi:hypothetical protein [Halovivax limisalsi]|uniref:hypothetical protein n=1 Tax=Halovivax limisalsi TaxID=1453760 RepID=UPI001FFC4885|nr:hypothetical protein [Halovivax limisalsi]
MDRRSLLARGTTAAVASVAGCLGVFDGENEQNDGGGESNGGSGPNDADRSEAGQYGLGDFGRWIPTAAGSEANPVTVIGMAPASLSAVDDTPLELGPGKRISDQPIAFPPAEDIDFVASASFGLNRPPTDAAGATLVLHGTLDPDAAAADLEAEGYERDTSVREFECYTDGRSAWGLGSETFVAARGPDSSVERLERSLAASVGDDSRLVEERDRFQRLATAQPAGDVVFAEHATGSVKPVLAPTAVDEVVAAGESFDVGAEETTITTTLVFSGAEAATEARLEGYVTDSGADPASVTTRLDGDVGEIELTRPTDELL